MKIYIVQGTCGTYEDRITWCVKAFYTQQEAEDYRNNCQATAETLYKEVEEQNLTIWQIDPSTNPYDPSMLTDYTGTSYFIITTELVCKEG